MDYKKLILLSILVTFLVQLANKLKKPENPFPKNREAS